MKVTEQIDALRAMAIHPVRYLVVPRVIAAIVMLPIMTIFSDAIAIFGGYLTSAGLLGDAAVAEMEGRIADEIDEAFAFALASPYPTEADLLRHVYAE